MGFCRTVRIGLAAACAGLLAAMAGRADAAEPIDLRIEASSPRPPPAEVALHVRDAADKDALALSALAHEALDHRGIRVDFAAPYGLTLVLARPLVWTGEDPPLLSLDARIGSSSEPSYGLDIAIPMSRPALPEGSVRVALSAVLEARDGTPLWRADAHTMVAGGDEPDAIRRLTEAVIDALAHAGQGDPPGGGAAPR